MKQKNSLKVSLPLPEIVSHWKRVWPSGIELPVHYSVCAALIALSTMICLLLPETGSIHKLPSSLQEAEMFNSSFNSSANGKTSSKWYSFKVLFNFQPPK